MTMADGDVETQAKLDYDKPVRELAPPTTKTHSMAVQVKLGYH